MKIYKLEIMVIDFDGVGDEIKDVIENTKYPNRCIHPVVKRIESRDIGEWSDDNPLNNRENQDAEYQRLFAESGNATR